MQMGSATPHASVRSTWRIDPAESRIEVTVTSAGMPTATGAVRRFAGTIEFEEDDPTRSSFAVTLDAASIDTGEPTRDAHLRSAGFFDVARYPTIEVRSRAIDRRASGEYGIRAALTLRGQVYDVAFEAAFDGETRDLWGRPRADFTARASLDLTALGLTWNSDLAAGWIPIGDHVTVAMHVAAIKTPTPEAQS